MSEQPQPRLAVPNLTTVFRTRVGRFVAVDDVSFDVYPGECLGIVGESGSGKSVAALSIMGLIDYPGQIETGRIEFGGTDLRTLSEDRLRRMRGEEIGHHLPGSADIAQSALHDRYAADRCGACAPENIEGGRCRARHRKAEACRDIGTRNRA